MKPDLPTYHMEYKRDNIANAIMYGFTYIEHNDLMVGEIYATPHMMKEIVKNFIDEVAFDYIPEGIGIFRGAYLKFYPSSKDNEIIFVTHSEEYRLKLILI